MKKLWVTGASGFLGWAVCQQAQASWAVYGTYRQNPVKQPGVKGDRLDLTDYTALKQHFLELRPDAVIHLAAQSKPNLCETDPDAAYAINVTAAVNLAGLCADAAIPCVFTSTDMVFDGKNPPYRETDPVCPLNRYGEQKAIAEAEMRSCYPAIAIGRMPLMFGAAPTAPSFLQPFLKTLREGKELKLFTDEFRTPVSDTCAAQGLLLALEKASGILHLGGKERISRYEFGQRMVEVFELPQAKILPCLQADVPMAAARPADVSLDSSLAFSLGYQPRSIREALQEIKTRSTD